uniref:AlNc14C150G7497 protein n=1 Tax=Albugo laibachii Nc14 TaxID=890382 RepID=F0WLY4_9STRA|nr:AlNc14C150G7497 [Albugo laibachii Nc14]|eukprot:CCA22311.1 AlNc14C150G7497 [Albugo laibachii Nc14]
MECKFEQNSSVKTPSSPSRMPNEKSSVHYGKTMLTPRLEQLARPRSMCLSRSRARSSASDTPIMLPKRAHSISHMTLPPPRTRAASTGLPGRDATIKHSQSLSNISYSHVQSRYLQYDTSGVFAKQAEEQYQRRKRLENENALKSYKRQQDLQQLRMDLETQRRDEMREKLQRGSELHQFKQRILDAYPLGKEQFMPRIPNLCSRSFATQAINPISACTTKSTASTDLTQEDESDEGDDRNQENLSCFLDLELSSISSETSHDSDCQLEPFFIL